MDCNRALYKGLFVERRLDVSSYNPKKNVLGISHINVVVDDIEKATEFYARTLGFEPAFNDDGEMYYCDVNMPSFANNAGFVGQEVIVDVRFLHHKDSGLYLELMHYQSPQGNQEIEVKATNDLGGPRHIALEVANIDEAYRFLKAQADVSLINSSKDYGPPEELTPFPIKFFYWIDPWGVQWEMEQGRPMGTAVGICG